MEYRKFTKENLPVSLLGFGCMRLPILEGDSGLIDEVKAKEMVDFAINKGVNYFDTAYPYHQGNSEAFLGRALEDGLREKVYIATKLPTWLTNSYEDFDKYLEEQLDRLQTNYIDFYLLHSLNKKSWDKVKDLGVFDFLEKAKKEGKIKFIGFSFHDEFDVFKEIVDSYDWDFCQIQLNYIDRQYQAGLAGLKYIGEKGISLVIMEPIKGGKLASAPKEVLEIWDSSPIKRSPAQWALKWVYDFPEVSVVLSGMTTLDHVKENIEFANNSKPKSLSKEELELIDKVTKIYEERTKIGCTSCEYCLPCPENVAIPSIFTLYNNYYVYGNHEECKKAYKKLIDEGRDASHCVECGICEQLCPQFLEIISTLKDAHIVLSS